MELLWILHFFYLEVSGIPSWSLKSPWILDDNYFSKISGSSDYRIPCIQKDQNLQWYSGKKSKSIDGITCKKWSEVEVSSKEFRYFFSSRQNVESQSVGIRSHENYCRNPDNWKWGPWCFVQVIFEIKELFYQTRS